MFETSTGARTAATRRRFDPKGPFVTSAPAAFRSGPSPDISVEDQMSVLAREIVFYACRSMTVPMRLTGLALVAYSAETMRHAIPAIVFFVASTVAAEFWCVRKRCIASKVFTPDTVMPSPSRATFKCGGLAILVGLVFTGASLVSQFLYELSVVVIFIAEILWKVRDRHAALKMDQDLEKMENQFPQRALAWEGQVELRRKALDAGRT